MSQLLSLTLERQPFFFLWSRTVYGILVPQPGIEPAPPALEAQSLNLWTARKVPRNAVLNTGPLTSFFSFI